MVNQGKTHPADFDTNGHFRADRPPLEDAYKERTGPRGTVYYYARNGGRLLLGDNGANLAEKPGYELVQKDIKANEPQPKCLKREQHDRPLGANAASGGIINPYAPTFFG